MLRRRLLTVPTILIGTILCFALYFPVLLICLLISIIPKYRTLPHVWTFITGYLACETMGTLRLFYVGLRYRNSDLWIQRNSETQIWWAQALLSLGTKIFRLEFELSGQQALEGNSAIVFARHASIGDTVIPLVFFGAPRKNEGMRYVIKKELLVSPSLDIGGHRLSTTFVDRSGTDSAKELDAIANMVQTTPENESLLIFPEGTRNSGKKKAQLRRRHPELAPQLDRWPDLLPPRLGGVSTMLTHNPGKDVVFMAHTGFEGCANLSELLSGSWRSITVHIHLWRIPYADIPADHQAFIFSEWDKMQQAISALRVGEQP